MCVSKTNVASMCLDLGLFKPVVLNPPDAATSSSCCVDPPTIELFSLLLPDCNFAAVMDCNVSVFPMFAGDPFREVV